MREFRLPYLRPLLLKMLKICVFLRKPTNRRTWLRNSPSNLPPKPKIFLFFFCWKAVRKFSLKSSSLPNGEGENCRRSGSYSAMDKRGPEVIFFRGSSLRLSSSKIRSLPKLNSILEICQIYGEIDSREFQFSVEGELNIFCNYINGL